MGQAHNIYKGDKKYIQISAGKLKPKEPIGTCASGNDNIGMDVTEKESQDEK
jgi:hypothetical protein